MNNLGLTFHHIGLAVSQIEKATTFLSVLGYSIGPTIYDPLQKVHLKMCTHPTNPAMELIAPDKSDGKGPINELTRKNSSGIVYHTCYATENLAASLAKAQALGLHVYCVSDPKPAALFGGRKVSFYKISGMGLVEIVEPAETANPGSSQ